LTPADDLCRRRSAAGTTVVPWDHGSPVHLEGSLATSHVPHSAQRIIRRLSLKAGNAFTSNLIGQSEVVDQLLQRLDQRRLRPAVDRDSTVPADADLDAVVLDIEPKVLIPAR
jgi:hypothetical protein